MQVNLPVPSIQWVRIQRNPHLPSSPSKRHYRGDWPAENFRVPKCTIEIGIPLLFYIPVQALANLISTNMALANKK